MAVRIPEQHVFDDPTLAQVQASYKKWWDYYADPADGFLRFLRDCVYTSDEEARTDKGETAKKKFPINKTYVEHLIRYGILGQRLMVLPKSRRMTATWIVAAYCVWFGMFKEKRNILWQAQNGAKSADTLKNKMLYIIENIPHDRLAPFVEISAGKAHVPVGWDSRVVNYWTGRRDASGLVEITYMKKETLGTGQQQLVADSRIIGIAEGQNQWRQYTVSLGVLDEFAFFTNAQDSIKGARPAVGMSGQLIFISSANPGYMKEMIERPDEATQNVLGINWIQRSIPEHVGVNTWVSKQGYFVYRLHYTADPAKNTPEWTKWPGDDPGNPLAGLARQGYDIRQWNQEMEIDFSVHSGTPFYPEWQDNLHLRNLVPLPGVPLLLGFDFGLTPATVICQISPSGHLLVLDEVVSWDNGITSHADDLIALLNNKYPWWQKGKKKRRIDNFLLEAGEEHGPFSGAQMVTSFVDPAGLIRAQTDLTTPVDILREKGLMPQPSVQDPSLRMESVKRGLKNLRRHGELEIPALIVDPNCKTLVEGLRGGAKVGSTRFSKEKNDFSHVTEALEYVTVQLFRPTGRDPLERRLGKDTAPVSQPYIPKRRKI